MTQDEEARVFREAWIAGVRAHFPGEPKPGYVAPWDDTPEWERRAAGAVFDQVRQFLGLSEGHAARLTREQKGRFVAICWTAQMYRHFENPKPGYVADWADLPDWQKETDADIFEAIEKTVL
ncbi:hypothetical protein ADL22_05855 [Streptomyces sp. NRRL F-4489]|uniref:hypothetical protein n=1 Tax=Streptomyces sp. NRRL F-4489 TaxID=1609095 RepID=UPI00074773BA|nr:hypothetical protein [Streptomyces sp. NRRL F-4489]KUL51744.1 hypothetical protein ADL22_05855 [Streptomyces sp. NRRL F-4489]